MFPLNNLACKGLRNMEVSFHFLILTWHRLINSFLTVDKGPLILHGQYVTADELAMQGAKAPAATLLN